MSLITSEQQIKIRQIAQSYLRIQQNTEYLSNIFRFSRFKKKSLIRFQNQIIVDLKSFFKLIIQSTYLLYTCYVKKCNIYLSNDIYCYQRKDIQQDIYIEYIIQADYNICSEIQRQTIQKYYKKYMFQSQVHSQLYGDYVLKLIRFYLDKVVKYIPVIKTIKRAIMSESQITRQIQNLQSVLKHLQQNKSKLTHPKAIILSLQQSEMFMQNSILLKIMNNSIYSLIRMSKNSMQIFKYIIDLQNKLLGINSLGNSTQKHTILSKDIQIMIQECFKYLIKENIVSSELSLNQTKSNIKSYILGQIQGKDDDRKFLCRIKIFEKIFENFTNKKLEQICQTVISIDPLTKSKKNLQTKFQFNSSNSTYRQQGQLNNKKKIQKSDYMIQYIPNKNLICVKYITDVQLNIQNTDFIMYQCNNISFNWNSVSMQLVQKNQVKNVRRKERFVAFKTLIQFNAKDKPLFKILLLIDLVMISAKISEPELRKVMIKLEDYWKIQEIGNKINHIINLFIKKVDKVYKSLAINLVKTQNQNNNKSDKK